MPSGISLYSKAIVAVGLSASLLGAGCSLQAMTGDMLTEYTVQHLNPFMLELGDLGMACEIAQSLGGQLLSYERVTDRPNKAGVATMASAGSCIEAEAWEHELRGLRAIKRADAGEAQDARIAEKGLHAVAARRFYMGYGYLVHQYGEPGGKCPKFKDETDELTWLLGSISLAQAVQHDRAAEGAVGVPLDAPRKVADGIRCLDDTRWWGVPSALQAAIWTGIPGATPEGKDPWAQLDAAALLAEKSGVRLALAIRAQAASAAGKTDVMRDSIRRLAASQKALPSPKAWLTLDLNARSQARAISDRLWTTATGHRTPLDGLGTFWDDASDSGGGADDLLDDLGDADPSAAPSAPASAASPAVTPLPEESPAKP